MDGARAWQNKLAVIFRDEERGNKISLAIKENSIKDKWKLFDIFNNNLGSWEPTYDTDLWKKKHELHLFVEQVMQADGEGVTTVAPQMIAVVEYKFLKEKN